MLKESIESRPTPTVFNNVTIIGTVRDSHQGVYYCLNDGDDQDAEGTHILNNVTKLEVTTYDYWGENNGHVTITNADNVVVYDEDTYDNTIDITEYLSDGCSIDLYC